METLRLLTLCSLASRSKALSYDTIATALQVRAPTPRANSARPPARAPARLPARSPALVLVCPASRD
jgi:hypothetical protein